MSDQQDSAKKGSSKQSTLKECSLREAPAAQSARKIQIVCAESRLAVEYRAELDRGGEPGACGVVSSLAEARKILEQANPLVTLLDESAVPQDDSLESAVALLAEAAPVVVVAAPERRWELTFLVTSGAADFVPRSGSFVAIAAARVEQRVRLSAVGTARPILPGEEFAGDFGEIFRHELRNELTGILGNAELLLVRRNRLPPDAVERVETIAQLAVRVRETVRRLSHAWDLWQRHPRSSSPAEPAEEAPAHTHGDAPAQTVVLAARTAANPSHAVTSPSHAATNPSTNSDARRSTTRLTSVPRMPSLQLEPELQIPETRSGAAAARWDRTWRTRKG
jgi:His Kinase A (phospho-acceptor) domain